MNWGSTGLHQLANSIAVGDTYVFSPNLVNSARLAFNRTLNRYIANLAFSHCTAGVNIWCGANPQVIGAMSITGLFTMGSTNSQGEYWTGTSYAAERRRQLGEGGASDHVRRRRTARAGGGVHAFRQH